MVSSSQLRLSEPPPPNQEWTVELSQTWDVLGPFPIQAREQQFLSPSFPLDLSQSIDFNVTWPSSYADGGRVSWSTALSNNGDLAVSFPKIRWESLRATEGWAALQHHAVLRTSLTVFPPQTRSTTHIMNPRLLVQLVQGSYFTILPTHDNDSDGERQGSVPEWHSGNIYDAPRSLPRTVNFPVPPSTTKPTRYDIFISGDYEIRLFGDPHSQNSHIPVQRIRLTIDVEDSTEMFVHEPTQDVVCDFVDGFSFGDAIGIGIRSLSEWSTVTDVALKDSPEGFNVQLRRQTRIAPSQTRIVPIIITQEKPYNKSDIQLDITVLSNQVAKTISVTLAVNQIDRLTSSGPFKATYFHSQTMPTVFLTVPPTIQTLQRSYPPILCLHGAGVDAVEQQFWAASLPKQRHSWLIIPTGRTSWGLDWHGPSAQDAWNSVDSLVTILAGRNLGNLGPNTPVAVMGHSNGGQGAWYLTSRYPDRVLGVVSASGYIKSQAYVPLTMSRSAHFIDPALRAVLETSLTPDDNDLFLSNIVDTPILAIHGGNDENVPVWHSREAVGIVQTYSPNANITFREDPGQGHWYPSVINNDQVQAFLDHALTRIWPYRPHQKTFTLTVSVPAESGSLHGWKIEQLNTPGRLAKLRVTQGEDYVSVVTSNVNCFSFDSRFYDLTTLRIDNAWIQLPPKSNGVIYMTATGKRSWMIALKPIDIQHSSRIQNILSSAGPIVFVVSDNGPSQELSAALRLAHDLNVYHRLDVEIIQATEELFMTEATSWTQENIVLIGTFSDPLVQTLLKQKKTPFALKDTHLQLGDRIFDETGLATIFLHPHPNDSGGSMLLMLFTDAASLERVARLFPIRTGISVPDWLVISKHADHLGAAGIVGAGVWGSGWNWNEAVSWLY